MIALLLACGDDEVPAGSWLAADFVLPEGVRLTFAPLDEPTGATWTLGLADGGWERRDGDSWDDGGLLETIPVEASDGVVVDGVRLLPAAFERGTAEGGTEVIELGAYEAWYGTFERAVTVETADGRLAGTNVFAEGLGPVALTLDGEAWDLVTYDPAPR